VDAVTTACCLNYSACGRRVRQCLLSASKSTPGTAESRSLISSVSTAATLRPLLAPAERPRVRRRPHRRPARSVVIARWRQRAPGIVSRTRARVCPPAGMSIRFRCLNVESVDARTSTTSCSPKSRTSTTVTRPICVRRRRRNSTGTRSAAAGKSPQGVDSSARTLIPTMELAENRAVQRSWRTRQENQPPRRHSK